MIGADDLPTIGVLRKNFVEDAVKIDKTTGRLFSQLQLGKTRPEAEVHDGRRRAG